MKSDTKKDPGQVFVEENHFVKHVVIHAKSRTAFFPDPEPDRKQFFEQVVEEQKNAGQSTQLFWISPTSYVYICKKAKSIYICECTNDVSISQVKMEFDAFIEDSQKQGKFPKFITSLFDR
ncbi:MAG: hypothetical protein D3926_06930 [Desulfobacteraceae bacterium]|nr:MAG: hypothetical protein D3926_06930 [Desulfobacteraceae bacterium]